MRSTVLDVENIARTRCCRNLYKLCRRSGRVKCDEVEET